MKRTRRPLRWLLAATLVGGGAALLTSRLHVASETTETTEEPAPPVARLGPLPVALPEESPGPARLSGGIDADLNDVEETAGSAEQAAGQMPVPPCEPPLLGDDPWRPSMRVASYQAEMPSAKPPPPSQPATPTPATPTPATPQPATSQPATPTPPAPTAKQEYLLHRIADGDTLTKLAHRYLGSSQRFLEIYSANRDRLASPDLLPIGVELRIPAGLATAPTPE